MAVDPRILFGLNIPSTKQISDAGIDAQKNIRNFRNADLQNEALQLANTQAAAVNPLLQQKMELGNQLTGQNVAQNEQLMPLITQSQQTANETESFKLDQNKGMQLLQTAQGLRKIEDQQQRDAAVRLMKPSLINDFGIPEEEINDGIDNEELEAIIGSLSGYLSNQGGMTEYQRASLAMQEKRLNQEGSLSPAEEQRLELQKQRLELDRRGAGLDQRKFAQSQEKIEREQAEIERSAKATAEQARERAFLVGRNIDSAKNMANNLTTGFSGSIMQAVPGTEAYDLKQTVETIEANIGFSELNRMRENSVSGASGLGQVTEKEMSLLTKVVGSLKQSQSKDTFMENLNTVEVIFDAIVNGSNAIPFNEEQFNKIQSGQTYIHPEDGKVYRKP